MRKFLLFLCLLAVPALAQEVHTLKARALEQAGVSLRSFTLVHVSEDGREVLGYDTPSVFLKKKGQKIRLWLIYFDSAYSLREARSFGLDIPGLEQANWAPDGKSIVLVTRQGSDFLKLDPNSGQVSPLMTHVKGQPGFRSNPQLLNTCDNKLLTVGYFYDAQDVSAQTTLAEIDPSKTGAAAFTSVLNSTNIEDLEGQVPNLYASVTLSPRALFFVSKSASGVTFKLWTPQQPLHDIDQAKGLDGMWGEQGRLVYSLLKAEGGSDLVLFDGITGNRQVLGTFPAPLQNLVLGRYGNTVAGCFKSAKGIDIMVGRDKDNFLLKPMLKDQPFSVLRLSPSGETLAAYNPITGLTLVRLP